MTHADWTNAPEWANWYTEDRAGAVYWENEPVFCEFDRVYWRRGLDNGTWQWTDTVPSSDNYIEQRP